MPDEPELRRDSASSDRELLTAVRNNDTEAFKTLFYRHSRAVHAYLQAALTSPDDTDDVFQEVFVLAWTKLDPRRLHGDSALPWLLVTARNLASNANRARSRQRTWPLRAADVEGADNALESAEHVEMAEAVRTALGKLDPIDHRIVELCFIEGLTYKEAAVRTRTTNAVVRNRLSRSRGFLRGEIATMTGDRHAR